MARSSLLVGTVKHVIGSKSCELTVANRHNRSVMAHAICPKIDTVIDIKSLACPNRYNATPPLFDSFDGRFSMACLFLCALAGAV